MVQLAGQLRVLAVDVEQQLEAVEGGRARRHAVLGGGAIDAPDVELLRERWSRELAAKRNRRRKQRALRA